MPRVATIGCGMLITIFFITCIIQNVFSAHLGRYSIERRSIDSRKENTVTASENVGMPRSSNENEEEAPTELPLPSIPLDLSFGARLPQSSTPNVNLFEEYMSRGLYTCTSSYLDSLGKLHALIAEVYADYQNCQNLIKTTPKTFSRTDIDALDDMLDEWEKEDQAVAAAIPSQKSSTTSQKSEPQQQQQQQELTEERREDAASEVVVVTAPDSTYPPSQM